MASIFLSYRRDDSRHQAGRIHDRLIAHFGPTKVFKDVDSMPLGRNFKTILTQRVAACDVFLAVIGDGWLSAVDKEGKRRLDDPEDFIRIEIEAALNREILVIPVLVGSAPVPSARDLPESLRELTFRQGMPVRPDPDFHNDMSRLIRGIEAEVESERAPSPSAQPRGKPSNVPEPVTDAPTTRPSGKFFLTMGGCGITLTLALAGGLLCLAVIPYLPAKINQNPEVPPPPKVVGGELPFANPHKIVSIASKPEVKPEVVKAPEAGKDTAPNPLDVPKPVVNVEAPPKPNSTPEPSGSTRFEPSQIRKLQASKGPIRDVSLSADGRFALTCDETRVRYYNVETGEDLIGNRLSLGTGNFIRCLGLSPRGGRALLGGTDKEVILWDFEERKEVSKLVHGSDVLGLSFTPDGRFAVTASREKLLRVWSTENGQEVRRFTIEETDTSFSMSADAKVGVNGTQSGSVEVWDGVSGEPSGRFNGHVGTVHGVALSGDARRLLISGEDGTVRLWDVEAGREIAKLLGHQGPVYAVSLSADGKLGLSGGMDGTVRVWRLAP